MLLLGEHLLPDVGHRFVVAESEDGADELREGHRKLVVGEGCEHFGFEDVALDVFLLDIVDGDAAVGVQALVAVFVKLLERHCLVGRGHHGGGSHDLFGFHLAELQKTLDGLVFLGFEHAFFHAHIDHGLHLLTAHREGALVGGKQARDEFGKEHQRIGDDDEHTNDAGSAHGQFSPIGGAHHLGDDFGDDKDEQGHHGRSHPDSITAPNFSRLRAHTGSTHGVGDGIERQNGGDRAVDVGFVVFEARGGFAALLFFKGSKGGGAGQQDGFEHGAKGRKRKGKDEIEKE